MKMNIQFFAGEGKEKDNIKALRENRAEKVEELKLLYATLEAEERAITDDEEKRAELYGQMQEIVLEEVPNIPLYTTPFYVAHSKNIDNVKQNPLGNYRFEELTKTN